MLNEICAISAELLRRRERLDYMDPKWIRLFRLACAGRRCWRNA
jgi:hypothetical protein